MKANFYVVAVAVAIFAAACADESNTLNGGKGPGTGPNGDGTATDQPPGVPADDPSLCTSRTYAGFDARQLHADRKVAKLGADRGRMKPFSALRGDFARVLGAAPATLQGAGATFGQVPAMWYEEPQANSVALQTAFTIAFDGCLTYTAKADFDAAPDAASAAAKCGAMARAFWSKTPSPQEIQACVDVATTGAAAEPQPRRKWAYACASVLSSAGFLTY